MLGTCDGSALLITTDTVEIGCSGDRQVDLGAVVQSIRVREAELESGSLAVVEAETAELPTQTFWSFVYEYSTDRAHWPIELPLSLSEMLHTPKS